MLDLVFIFDYIKTYFRKVIDTENQREIVKVREIAKYYFKHGSPLKDLVVSFPFFLINSFSN